MLIPDPVLTHTNISSLMVRAYVDYTRLDYATRACDLALCFLTVHEVSRDLIGYLLM